LRLAHRVAAGDRLLRHKSSQVNAFDVISHLGNATKRTHPLLIALRFVANADGALALGKDKRKWLEVGRGRFLLDERSLREGNPESVPSRHFAAATESDHKTGRVDPARDNLLRVIPAA
jgi:hypothetical protein